MNIGKLFVFMTPSEAVAQVRKDYPSARVDSCKDYDDSYLVTAYSSPDEMDPFYLVDKRTGYIRKTTISADLDRYYKTKNLKYE